MLRALLPFLPHLYLHYNKTRFRTDGASFSAPDKHPVLHATRSLSMALKFSDIFCTPRHVRLPDYCMTSPMPPARKTRRPVLWASPLWFREAATTGAEVSNYGDPDRGRVRFEGFESEGASHENVY